MSESTLIVERNVEIPMRDGTVLRADVYRPAAGTYPVIQQRTQYDKGLLTITMLMLDVMRTASEGYAVVIQDTRGRYTSGGEFYTFRDDITDGYDTVEWCAAQSWSDGNVGMYGGFVCGGDAVAGCAEQTTTPQSDFPTNHRIGLPRGLDLSRRCVCAWI